MSIQKRTVFYDNTGGVVRFWDWARVTTTLGSMSEPFNPGLRHTPNANFETVDPADEINRIDDMRALSVDVHMLALSGGDDHTIGGYQLPRTGR